MTPIQEAFANGWVPKPRPVEPTSKRAIRMAKAANRAKVHMVYFFQHGDGGPIKIGVAVNPMTRLANIQAGSPVPVFLRGLIPGSFDREREIHRHLAGYRLRGEWFSPAPEVLAYVRRVIREAAWIGADEAWLNPVPINP